MIKAIIKQNKALRLRMPTDRYISENQEKTPVEREEAKKRMERNQATYEKNEEEKKQLLERIGIKNSVLEQEREVFQKEKEDLDMLIENDKKLSVIWMPLLLKEKQLKKELRSVKEKENGFQSVLSKPSEILGLKIIKEKKIKEIFKKYGVTVTAIILAAGATIGAVIGVITSALKKLGKGLANGHKTIGKKAASALPGLIGAIASFLFKAAASVIGYLAEHTWLLILAVVALLFQKLMEKR